MGMFTKMHQLKVGLIYFYKHKQTNKYYIGQTCRSFEARHKQHLQDAKYQKGKSPSYFHNSLYKDGEHAFERGILEENIPIEHLNSHEMIYIFKYKAQIEGYNLTSGGHYIPKSGKFTNGVVKGYKRSQEEKDHYSAAQKKRFEEPNNRIKNASQALINAHNLRLAGPKENQLYKGITKYNDIWIAQVSSGKNRMRHFKTAYEAALHRDKMIFDLYGFDAYLNFPEAFAKTRYGKDTKSCYLCGSIENAKDKGTTWRDAITLDLHAMGKDILDPCVIEKQDMGNVSIVGDMLNHYKKERQFDALYVWMTKIVNRDKRAISHSDCMIFMMDHNAKNGGTYCELEFALKNKIPIYGLCLGDLEKENCWIIWTVLQSGAIFTSKDKLLEYLKRGTKQDLEKRCI